jgi:hypothetical protein
VSVTDNFGLLTCNSEFKLILEEFKTLDWLELLSSIITFSFILVFIETSPKLFK